MLNIFQFFFVLFVQNDDIFTEEKNKPILAQTVKMRFFKHKNTIVAAVFLQNDLLYITKISILFVLN